MIAKHRRVRDYLRALATHELAEGESIPSERELAERFSVSRMTIRQAVDALVIDGLLERKQGKGTFVTSPKIDLQARLTSFEEEMTLRGLVPSSVLMSAATLPARIRVADALNLASGDDVYCLHRVRLADAVPIAVEKTWLPAGILPRLLEPQPPRNIYDELSQRGLKPEWGEDTVEATEATCEEADLLGIDVGKAVLKIERRSFTGNVAVEYTQSVYRGDRHTLWVPLTTRGRGLYRSSN